jgi:hypothetical protein
MLYSAMRQAEPRRWLILRRSARALQFVAALVVSLGYVGGFILICVDVVMRVSGGSVSLLGAPLQVLVDMVLLSFLLGIPYFLLLGLARLILSRIPAEYQPRSTAQGG